MLLSEIHYPQYTYNPVMTGCFGGNVSTWHETKPHEMALKVNTKKTEGTVNLCQHMVHCVEFGF